MDRRLAVMEERRNGQGSRQRLDLRRLNDDDLDSLGRLALDRQTWPGSLEGWLAFLGTDDHDELLRLHALARWS